MLLNKNLNWMCGTVATQSWMIRLSLKFTAEIILSGIEIVSAMGSQTTG